MELPQFIEAKEHYLRLFYGGKFRMVDMGKDRILKIFLDSKQVMGKT